MIPTTLEMDKIFTEKDTADRFFIMKPCVDCGLYTKQDTRAENNKPCSYCGGKMGLSSTYWCSIRTWVTNRRLTPADRKKMGTSR